VNPDASRIYAAPGIGGSARHGQTGRRDSFGTVDRLRAATRGALPRRNHRHNTGGRGRNGCRSRLEPGSARTGKADQTAPRHGPHNPGEVDAPRRRCDTACAFVPRTVQGTAPKQNLPVMDRRRACLPMMADYYRARSAAPAPGQSSNLNQVKDCAARSRQDCPGGSTRYLPPRRCAARSEALRSGAGPSYGLPGQSKPRPDQPDPNIVRFTRILTGVHSLL
jgi:hypothetical protein